MGLFNGRLTGGFTLRIHNYWPSEEAIEVLLGEFISNFGDLPLDFEFEKLTQRVSDGNSWPINRTYQANGLKGGGTAWLYIHADK